MGEAVYILSALTSIGCVALLLRAYLKNRVKLLLWSSLCFAGLAVNNIILFIDLVIVPEKDLSLWRNLSALIGMILLIYGLIWDSR